MALPAKLANREDRLHLDRTIQCVSEAKDSLKSFSKTDAVEDSSNLPLAVKEARRRLRKAMRAAQLVAELWHDSLE